MPEQVVELKDVHAAVNDMRESLKKYGADSVDFKAKQEKVEAALVDFDAKNQKLTTELQEAKNAALEASEKNDKRIADLELEVIKKSSQPGVRGYKDTDEYKALNNFIKHGDIRMKDDEIKALRTDINTAGGYLTTTEMNPEIDKTITEISPMRQVAFVKSIGSKTLTVPTRTSIPTATFEGEAEASGTSQSAYGAEIITPWRLTVTVPYTQDMLNDSEYDLATEINGDVAEAFGQKEGNKFVLGTGVKEPYGFTTNATILANKTTSTVTGSLAAIDLITLSGALKAGYNPIYTMNRQALAVIRGLQTTNGNFIWHAGSADGGMAGSIPNTIAGEPYVIMQDMANFANGSYSVAFGDFKRGYKIVDRAGMTIIRDDVTQKKAAIIELTFHKYVTGQVVRPEAIQILLTKS